MEGWGGGGRNELSSQKDRCSCSLRVGTIADGKARARRFLVQVFKECAGFAGKIKLDKDKHALLILIL